MCFVLARQRLRGQESYLGKYCINREACRGHLFAVRLWHFSEGIQCCDISARVFSAVTFQRGWLWHFSEGYSLNVLSEGISSWHGAFQNHLLIVALIQTFLLAVTIKIIIQEPYLFCEGELGGATYFGNIRGVFKKSFKTNSKKYFIYEIYKIIFLHSFHPIHNTSVSDVSIEKFRPGIF